MTDTTSPVADATFPEILVSGSPRERGEQIGELASAQVHRTIDAYRQIYAHYGKLDWSEARERGQAFSGAIESFDPRISEEIGGIASGAGVDTEDILAINARTEIIAAASLAGGTGNVPAECTSFGVFPYRHPDESTVIGQNWDWLELTRDSLIVLKVRQDDRPSFVTVVEAGLMAKCGMNSAGLGLATNALTAESDRGAEGVPYHILLRGILESETIPLAMERILGQHRASSANYLVGHAAGLGLDLECTAGDFRNVSIQEPEDGLLLHTNHFFHPSFSSADVSVVDSPDSPLRLERIRQLLTFEGATRGIDELQQTLADHVFFPMSICAHAEEEKPAPERWATLASVLMDLGPQRMWLAPGKPCETPYVELSLDDVLA